MIRAPYKRSSQKITFVIYFPGKTYIVGILMRCFKWVSVMYVFMDK